MSKLVVRPEKGTEVVISANYISHMRRLPIVTCDVIGTVIDYLSDGKSEFGAGGLPYGVKVKAMIHGREYEFGVEYPYYSVV